MENNSAQQQDVIDLGKIFKLLMKRKRAFLKIWGVTFVLACIWILPQPRYYTSSVRLAPEVGVEVNGGGLASIASNFGFNLGGAAGNDAIYPMIYPDLFQSPGFVVGLFDIKVTTDDHSLTTDYYTYLTKHQKKNVLTQPFKKAAAWVKGLFEKPATGSGGTGHDAFRMTKEEEDVMKAIQSLVKCDIDKKTEIISLVVRDQDSYIAATLADSVRGRLQNYITSYRTEKARLDMEYYANLADSARREYHQAQNDYSAFYDSHVDVSLQSVISQRDRLENDLQLKYDTYQAMMTQYQAMKAKVQEHTPAFTVIQTPTVSHKPTEPKRMLFVVGMLIMATIISSLWFVRKEIL